MHKLAYEWKNIYRTLSNMTQANNTKHGIAKVSEF